MDSILHTAPEPSSRHSRRDIAILRCSKLFFDLDGVSSRETLAKKLEEDPADKSIIVRKLRDREVDDRDSYEELFPLLCVERGKNCNLFAKRKLFEISKIMEDVSGEGNDDNRDDNDGDGDEDDNENVEDDTDDGEDDTDDGEDDTDDGEDDTDDEESAFEWPGKGFWSRIDANGEVYYLHVYPARKLTASEKLVRESAASNSIVSGWRIYPSYFFEAFKTMQIGPIKDVRYKFAISNPQSFSLKNYATLAVLRDFGDHLDRPLWLPTKYSNCRLERKVRMLRVDRCYQECIRTCTLGATNSQSRTQNRSSFFCLGQ